MVGYATLYTRIRKRNPNVDIFVNSFIQVDIIAWEKANSGLEEWNKFLKTKDGKEIYSKMQGVDNALDYLTGQGVYDKSLIDEVVANVIYKDEREQQRIKEEERHKRNKCVSKQKKKQPGKPIFFFSCRISWTEYEMAK